MKAIALFAIAAIGSLTAQSGDAEARVEPSTLTTQAIEGSKWRIVRLNNVRPPQTGVFNIDFRRGKAKIKFGCNLIDADFRIESGTVVVGKNRAKEFDCSEPFAGFERDGMAIIKMPMSGRWIEPGKRLELFNEAGTLLLVRR